MFWFWQIIIHSFTEQRVTEHFLYSKCKVLENSPYTAREACDELSRLTRSEQVQVIGSKFVLYRQQPDKSKRKIELIKAAKKG